MGDAVRLRGRHTIEVIVDERGVVIDGGLGGSKAGDAFWLEPSTRWRWADGAPMTEAERVNLVDAVPRVGREHGWDLQLDEVPRPVHPPVTSLFECKGAERLEWTSGRDWVAVPGTLTFAHGRPTFAIDMSAPWTGRDGRVVSVEERERLATAICEAAPANGVLASRGS